MQFLTARCNLEIRKLTYYGITRLRSIRKSKQISEQTILSSPQDIEFNPNFAKNCDIRMVKNSVTKARHASVTDRYALHNLLKRQIKSQFEIKSFSKPIILTDCSIFFRYNILRPRDSVTHFHVQFQTGDFPQKMVCKQVKQKKSKN